MMSTDTALPMEDLFSQRVLALVDEGDGWSECKLECGHTIHKMTCAVRVGWVTYCTACVVERLTKEKEIRAQKP